LRPKPNVHFPVVYFEGRSYKTLKEGRKNKEQKFLVILTSLSLIGLAFIVTLVRAQEQEIVSIGEVSDSGILPDSPFYFVKSWGRTIRFFRS